MPSDNTHFKKFSLNVRGRLTEFDRPLVMAILNVTPDSFYAKSRFTDTSSLERGIETIVAEGADIIDIGGCSTRPDASPCTPQEEWRRLEPALKAARKIAPEHILISVDTFRSGIARRVVADYGADIINDVSGGDADSQMFTTVAGLGVPYVLTHSGGIYLSADKTNIRIGEKPSDSEDEDVICDLIRELSEKKTCLNHLGVSDTIVDPGIGFGKRQSVNFAILKNLPVLTQTLQSPLLIGLSRKSLITGTLGCSGEEAGTGTTVLNTVALKGGASILRVHDVAETRQAITLLARLGE